MKGELPEGTKSKKDLINLNNGNTGFESLREAVNKLVTDSRNRIARQRSNRIRSHIRDFNVKLCDLIKSDFEIDFNSEIKETLQENEMNRIYNEWWATRLFDPPRHEIYVMNCSILHTWEPKTLAAKPKVVLGHWLLELEVITWTLISTQSSTLF